MTLPAHPFGTDITSEAIVAKCSSESWEDRYRNVIQLGKKLPALPEGA